MSDSEKVYRWLTQAELNAMLDDAYRRGAEAMRETAAQEVCGYSVTVLNPFGGRVRVDTDGLGGLADIIRALPLPKKEP